MQGSAASPRRLSRYPEKRKCRQGTQTLFFQMCGGQRKAPVIRQGTSLREEFWGKTSDICGQSAHRGETCLLRRERPGASRAQVTRQEALAASSGTGGSHEASCDIRAGLGAGPHTGGVRELREPPGNTGRHSKGSVKVRGQEAGDSRRGPRTARHCPAGAGSVGGTRD